MFIQFYIFLKYIHVQYVYFYYFLYNNYFIFISLNYHFILDTILQD